MTQVYIAIVVLFSMPIGYVVITGLTNNLVDWRNGETFEAGYLVLLFVILSNAFCSSMIRLIRIIYKWHRMAFRTHVKQLVVLSVITMGCIIWLITVQLILFYGCICVYYEDNEAMVSTVGDHSFCSFFETVINKTVRNNSNMWGYLNTMDSIAMLTAVIAFYALENPHDCFACFGKDPDRVYSGFQMTLEDRIARRYFARFNKFLKRDIAAD